MQFINIGFGNLVSVQPGLCPGKAPGAGIP